MHIVPKNPKKVTSFRRGLEYAALKEFMPLVKSGALKGRVTKSRLSEYWVPRDGAWYGDTMGP